MPSHRSRSAAPRRGLFLALVSGCLLISTAGAGRATEGDGLGGLFGALFGGGAARSTAPAAIPQPLAEPTTRLRRRLAGRNRADARAALRHRARYAALPKAPAEDKAGALKVLVPAERITNPSEARAALLRDPTLRHGDIVIMPEGPRVFVGAAGSAKHRPGEFEDVRRSRVVNDQTRRELLARTAPIGALPADEARKLMARLVRHAPKPWTAPEEARTETAMRSESDARAETAMRVIYPAR
ncbi:conserved hypothetical protein [Methylobacterium sp. 4-46]|uniref:hypothetical protein n=1 Tax=unclassified Methylobacterium TaxID=2615210 RepID=UPI000152C268|nr:MULTISPECIES: hypothetical protein [Methylobacterium]ACA19254.1 conserved hypothetical protein [Methylobacterium sp. 4-46]WFT78461.1 hypothetical protein QA634_24765 [Methylobacterium nodulans]